MEGIKEPTNEELKLYSWEPGEDVFTCGECNRDGTGSTDSVTCKGCATKAWEAESYEHMIFGPDDEFMCGAKRGNGWDDPEKITCPKCVAMLERGILGAGSPVVELRSDFDKLNADVMRAICILDGNEERIDYTDKANHELLRKLCEHLLAWDEIQEENIHLDRLISATGIDPAWPSAFIRLYSAAERERNLEIEVARLRGSIECIGLSADDPALPAKLIKMKRDLEISGQGRIEGEGVK